MRLLLFVALTLFLLSCASSPELADTKPPWMGNPAVSGSDNLILREVGQAPSPHLAETLVQENLSDKVILAMGLGDPTLWDKEGQKAVRKFKNSFLEALNHPHKTSMEGLKFLHEDVWQEQENNFLAAVEMQWNWKLFLAKAQEMARLVQREDPVMRGLEVQKELAEETNGIYALALALVMAANDARNEGQALLYRQLLFQVPALLETWEYEIVSFPSLVYAGRRPDSPVIFKISSEGQAIKNVEFLVQYPRLLRDQTTSIQKLPIFSSREGLVTVLPPATDLVGPYFLNIMPSAENFLAKLEEPVDDLGKNMARMIEQKKTELSYEVLTQKRRVATGILLLDTDVTGSPFSSSATSNGLFDDLKADGFNVQVMTLDPREMLSRNDKVFLRNLKADPRFSAVYERVIFGIIALEEFEQNGDRFSVRVSGTLSLADIQKQVVLYRKELSKTSLTTDSQQAITTAFRQLGTSFARELIEYDF